MTLTLYYHPFSSYCQKAVTALYEKGLAFEGKLIDGSEPVMSEFKALWPVGKMPLLVDDGRTVFEATAIVEYLDARFPETARMIPADPLVAVDVRMWERFFDNYIAYPQFRLLAPRIGQEVDDGGEKWRAKADTALAVLDAHMDGREWAAGDAFSLADCAAAPHLLYIDWTYGIPDHFRNVWAYRDRLLARPSYARALDEARPYRAGVPMNIPENRD
ncbi:glutathione S-transferase family protein [Hyphomonas johnsonii]|jgi:glutathione S-transferase|uniref:Glutathione S-transferase domain-containing protein n=1 Tax=Hyphomonas johnsonii MHS-2 TaxID=1280950 RepID=A0A059FHD6_9PROT|nr:glutathione S-transferase family protein [Hyphomonas johnsonii]KCZ90035.1 glutathione S-transferase domain-containing protein [Hyphomonas johnsonii MHS-2]